jgi:hypothetical protein
VRSDGILKATHANPVFASSERLQRTEKQEMMAEGNTTASS